MTAPASTALAASVVRIGRSVDGLAAVTEPGVELAAWRREPEPAWGGWLETLSFDLWPACRLELAPQDALAALDASFDGCGTPRGPGRDAFAADLVRLARLFSELAQTPRVRLRLDRLTDDACRRWHRDCVPLRLICTYRGPGTQWVAPADGPLVIAQPDEDAPQALSFRTADVALFKGCGWTGQPHDGGIVHRSPRIAGTGVARLVLVMDAAWPVSQARTSS